MISEWQPNTDYFTIIDYVSLDLPIPVEVKEKLIYTEDYTLKDCLYVSKELSDGRIAINIQLSPEPLREKQCVNNFITEQDFELAKQLYGVTEFYTIEEFNNLK